QSYSSRPPGSLFLEWRGWLDSILTPGVRRVHGQPYKQLGQRQLYRLIVRLHLVVLPRACHNRRDRRGPAERRFPHGGWVVDPHSVCRVLKDAMRDLDRGRGTRQVMKLRVVLGIRPLSLRLAAALLLLAINCTAPSAPAPPSPQTAAALPDAPGPTSLPAQTGPARDALAYPGKVQVRWSVDVTPRVTGRIE